MGLQDAMKTIFVVLELEKFCNSFGKFLKGVCMNSVYSKKSSLARLLDLKLVLGAYITAV